MPKRFKKFTMNLHNTGTHLLPLYRHKTTNTFIKKKILTLHLQFCEKHCTIYY